MHPTPAALGADPDPTSSLSRRRLLIATGAVVASAAAAACGSDDSGENAATDDGGPTSTGAPGVDTSFLLVPSFPVAEPFLLAGVEARMPFVIGAPDGAPLDEISGPVVFTATRDGSPVGDPVEVEPRAEGLTRAYLPYTFTFPEPGVYQIEGVYEGEPLIAPVQVFPADQSTTPLPGQPLPAVDTPTTTDGRGVSPICTDKPPCDLHSQNLADVVGNGRPTALLVSTPAFCQTAICGPVLDLVIDAAERYPGIDVVHAEVYANPEEVQSIAEATPAPVIDALGLTYEPSLFVADSSGIVTSRLDLIFDAGELDEALSAVS